MRNAKKLEIAPVRKQTEEDRGSGGREGQVRAKGKRKARAREGAHGRGGWTEQEGREGSKGDVAERMGKGTRKKQKGIEWEGGREQGREEEEEGRGGKDEGGKEGEE